MRRAQAILVIVALLAIPLALLARSGPCEQTQCLCCLTHGSTAQQGKPGMHCHCPAGHMKCGMSSGRQVPDYGLIAPIAPTAPGALLVVAEPDAVRQPVRPYSQAATPGFDLVPFEPPRA